MRMVYLLDHAHDLFGRALSPDEILCLTFTRKAAAEIAERAGARIAAVFGEDPARPPVSVATYNGYAASLVAEHGLRLGVDPDAATVTDAALWQIADDIVTHWESPVASGAAVSTLTGAVSRFAAQTREHLTDPAAVRDWAERTLTSLQGLPGARGGTALVNANGNPTEEAKQAQATRDAHRPCAHGARIPAPQARRVLAGLLRPGGIRRRPRRPRTRPGHRTQPVPCGAARRVSGHLARATAAVCTHVRPGPPRHGGR
ncbi:hypothetical protein GCM10025876_26620 [Demequina litorisediminis]|uniref:UvrD-like helicase ATP-binding domain-containing protein n=1 Tax=Demequina litorisediminis TaxID=1849022 RepID=A0ABQ6IEZ5_9MICO|nr:hypothetical protein GCM10025876_26620 [Demequina litorisediminis]